MSRKQIAFLLALCLVVLVLAGATFLYTKEKKDRELNEAAKLLVSETVEYKDRLGNPVSLAGYLGKILVVTTWASWSPYSVADLPALDRLADTYAGEVSFLAVNRAERKDQAERFLSTLPPLNKLVILLDETDNFYTATLGYTMPETIVFDEAGIIVQHFYGQTSEATLSAEIDKLLAD